MKIKAFTLTELLIALAVVGVLVAILLPVILNLLPDQNALMAKRAYYTVQTITSNLLNDDACYPPKEHAQSADMRGGLDDGYGYADCKMWGGKYNEGSITTENANSKFITLFRNKLDASNEPSSETTFTTKDGIKWTAQNMQLAHSNSKPSIEFMIDVNGDDAPNCKSKTDNTNCSKKKEFDRFTVKIDANGGLTIVEDWAKNAVGINADITGADKNP